MAANQPQWPREWLMTDERIGDLLWQAVERVPAGGGVVLRHYSLAADQRLELGLRLTAIARDKDLVLAVARSRSLAEALGAPLVHNPDSAGELPCSLAVHDEVQAQAARQAGAALSFISPVYPTWSHPGGASLGAKRAARLAAMAGCSAIALGGMSAARFDELQQATSGSFHGYAGIDCWLRI